MGLDMYMCGYKGNDENNSEDIGYWRKHANLHGYIIRTYADGVDECQRIRLTADDIAEIRDAVANKRIHERTTTGFFFGQSYGDDREAKNDIHILDGILKRMRQDSEYKVFYQASW